MPIFKSPEERAEARERRAHEKFLKSPLGRATTAHDQGDPIFQVTLPVGDSSAPTLAQIEALGWRLDHAGYAYVIGDTTSVGVGDDSAYQFNDGHLAGVYLFRRT